MEKFLINPEFPDRQVPELAEQEQKPPAEKTPEDIENDASFKELYDDLKTVFTDKLDAYKTTDINKYFDAQNKIADFTNELYKKYTFEVKRSPLLTVLLGGKVENWDGAVLDYHKADEDIQDFIINQL